eukprot:m.439207 g.439207  ORF g.439207 m.439207 type:complete len:417 (+) comp18350_c0_seq1:79-1329(+)
MARIRGGTPCVPGRGCSRWLWVVIAAGYFALAPGQAPDANAQDETLWDETDALIGKLEKLGQPGKCKDVPVASAAVHRELDALELMVAQLLQVASGKTFPDLAASEPGIPYVPQPTPAAHPESTHETASGENGTILDDDVEGEIVKVCAVPRPLLRIGLLSFIVLLTGAPLIYVFYNRKSIIDALVDKEFETLDVNNSNTIDANEFYIAVLQMYLKVNRVTTILPPTYPEIRRYFDNGREMDREEFKTAVAILIDTTLKRVVSSLVLALCTPWIAPYIVDGVALAVVPLIYVADISSCGHMIVVIIGTIMNRQLFTTITSVLLVLIALPRVFMWIDKEEQQLLDGEADVSILGRIKTFFAAPKLIQKRIVELKQQVEEGGISVSQRLSARVNEVRTRARVIDAMQGFQAPNGNGAI